jgi:hypothetical protein
VEREIEFGGELDGVEGAAGEEVVAVLDGGDFAFAVIDAEDEVFGVGIVFDVDFTESDAAIFEEVFGAAAIGAPGGAVNGDRLRRVHE